MCFSTSSRFVKASHLLSTNVVLCLAGWSNEAWVTKAKWEPGYKPFVHENGLKFSKKVDIFSKIDVSSKKDLHFLRGAFDAAPWSEPWMHMPSVPPNTPLVKWREAYCSIFRSWSSLEIFLPTHLLAHIFVNVPRSSSAKGPFLSWVTLPIETIPLSALPKQTCLTALAQHGKFSIVCLFQGHSNTLHYRESNQGFETLRLLTQLSTNWDTCRRFCFV